MNDLTEEQYQVEYEKARADLDSAAKPEEVEAITEEVPEVEIKQEDENKPEELSELEKLKKQVEDTQKALKDTQAWATKNAQRLADIEREKQQQQREQQKPAILDANPELADAIRYVTADPLPQQHQEQGKNEWMEIVNKAHPGIFDSSLDKELEEALMTKLTALGDEISDPLVAIREITAEKLAFTERQIGRRFTIEAENARKKAAMSVPGVGASTERINLDKDLADANRIKNMSPSEFEKEKSRVLGY